MRFANLIIALLNDSNIVLEGGQVEEASGRHAVAAQARFVRLYKQSST